MVGSWHRLGVLSGILGPMIWLLMIGIAGAMRPEFSHIRDYISELGERGSSTELMMRYAGFVFTGFLYLCYATTLMTGFRDNWLAVLGSGLLVLDGLGRIGSGVFPCDPGCDGVSASQDLHRLFATIGFLSGVLAAVVWGIIFFRQGWPRSLAVYSIVTGIAALILLILMQWSNSPGCLEHLASGILSLWLLLFAVRLMRNPG
jgi:hypothetical membrane protein